ncbi:MAG: hypothetical protein SynsKO_28180 [Synoicihabitans sp.]
MEQSTSSPRLNRVIFIAAAVLLVASVVISRWPWLDHEIWNLDEGSTMTMAQKVLSGDVLYRDAVDNRSPLVPYAKALVFAVFGDWNDFAIHLTLAVSIGVSGVLLAWIGLRRGGKGVAIAIGLSFAVLQFSFVDARDSMSAHTEWFVLVFSTVGFALLVKFRDRPTFIAGLPIGLCFGLSTLSKQPGLLDYFVASIILAFLAFAYPAERKALARWWAGMTTALVTALAAVSLYFIYHDAHAAYIYYAFTFNTQVYVPEYPLIERLLSIQKPFEMARQHVPIIASIAALAALAAVPHTLRRTWRPRGNYPLLALIALGWLCSGLVSATLGGRGFAHYSATIIPGMSLLFGWIVGETLQRLQPRSNWLSLTGGLVLALPITIQFWHQHRNITEALDTAEQGYKEEAIVPLKFTTPEEKIFVWGYAPEIYFYAKRLPSTRFIYTNYVTGLLPWTNIDPLRDVSYGITPNAAEFLARDFAADLPALVVDTRNDREYSRFPIAKRDEIWPHILENYVEVALPDDVKNGSRYYRKLENPTPIGDAKDWAVSTDLALSGFNYWNENEPPQLEVRGPSGFDQLDLVINGRTTATLRYPPEEPIGVRFFIPHQPLTASEVTVRASGPDGAIESRPFNFANYALRQSAQVPAGPVLTFGETKVFPLAVHSKMGLPEAFPFLPEAWHLQAPARIEFDFPKGLKWISFHHGLNRAIIDVSDGYDLALNWIGDEGQRKRIWERRNSDGSHPLWTEPQVENVDLPQLDSGRLEFIFTHGRFGKIHHDRFHLGPIIGETGIPFIAYGSSWLSAQFAEDAPYQHLKGHGPGRWQLPPGRELSWDRPALFSKMTFEFGVDDAIRASAIQNSQPTFAFVVEMEDERGDRSSLFRRVLDPVQNPEDRGPQRASIHLPQSSGNRIHMRITENAESSSLGDFTWIGNLRGFSVGPAFELEPGYFINSTHVEGHPSVWGAQPHPTRWNAHPPLKLVYPKPKELRKLTVRYGMFDDAIRSQGGHHATDGVEFIVAFNPTNGSPQELFRREINPFEKPDDKGEQISEISLPVGREGEVILRVDSRENASWDWAYWGVITGETTQADYR